MKPAHNKPSVIFEGSFAVLAFLISVINVNVYSKTCAFKNEVCCLLAGSDHCLIVEHLEGEYIRRSNVKPLLWDSDIQLTIDELYTRLQIRDGKNQDKILFILDGFDELPKKSKKVLVSRAI